MAFEIVRAIEHLIVVCCVPILIVIGYRLFVLGVTGKMELSAHADRWQGKVTNAAPGTVCFLLAVMLGAFVLTNKLQYKTPSNTPTGGNGVFEFLGGGGVYLSQPLRRAMADVLMCERGQGLVSDTAKAQCQAL